MVGSAMGSFLVEDAYTPTQYAYTRPHYPTGGGGDHATAVVGCIAGVMEAVRARLVDPSMRVSTPTGHWLSSDRSTHAAHPQ